MAGLKIGIELGTCYIKAVRLTEGKEPLKIKLDDDQNNADDAVLNSIHYFQNASDQIERIAGYQAQDACDDKNTVISINRFLQQKEWKQYIPALGREVSAVEVLSDLFAHIRKCTSGSGQVNAEHAVIAIPCHFPVFKKEKIRKAAECAGFFKADLILEPVAAVFGEDALFVPDTVNNVFVFDFGASKLDAVILQVTNKGHRSVKILSAGRISYGGSQINEDIYREIFIKKYPQLKTMEEHKMSERLRKELDHIIEEMKRELCNGGERVRPEALDIELCDGMEHAAGFIKKELGSMLRIKQMNKKIRQLVSDVMDDSHLNRKDMTHILYAGGSSRSIWFQEIIESMFLPELFLRRDDDEIYAAISNGAVRYQERNQDEAFEITAGQICETGICNEAGEFQKLLGPGCGYGEQNRSLKKQVFADHENRIPIYQVLAKEAEPGIKENADMVYAGYFMAESERFPDRNYEIELFLAPDGTVKGNLYHGIRLVTKGAELKI